MSNPQQYPPPAQQQRPGNPNQRTLLIALVAVAAVLVVVLVVLVAVGLSSGSDSEATIADNASNSEVLGPPAPAASDPDAPCKIRDADYLDKASWSHKQTDGDERQPTGVLVLTGQYALPPEFSPLADPEPNRALTQYQNRDIGVITVPAGGRNLERLLAVVDQDGTVVEVGEYETESDLPVPFDRAGQWFHGYYRIETAGQVQIPAEAGGNEVNMNFTTALLPDSFDDTKFWVLLRGSSDLYEAKLFQNSSGEWSQHGVAFGDTSQCSRQ